MVVYTTRCPQFVKAALCIPNDEFVHVPRHRCWWIDQVSRKIMKNATQQGTDLPIFWIFVVLVVISDFRNFKWSWDIQGQRNGEWLHKQKLCTHLYFAKVKSWGLKAAGNTSLSTWSAGETVASFNMMELKFIMQTGYSRKRLLEPIWQP